MPARPRIILTGATGLIGQALTPALTAASYEVAPLRSRTKGPGGMDVASGWIDAAYLEGAEAVIHLAGEPIAQRWTDAAKERILSSRSATTRRLAQALAQATHRPKVWLSMSGINRYGIHRPGETLTEESAVSDEGFLGQVSAAWEDATLPARQAGIRTAIITGRESISVALRAAELGIDRIEQVRRERLTRDLTVEEIGPYFGVVFAAVQVDMKRLLAYS